MIPEASPPLLAWPAACGCELRLKGCNTMTVRSSSLTLSFLGTWPTAVWRRPQSLSGWLCPLGVEAEGTRGCPSAPGGQASAHTFHPAGYLAPEALGLTYWVPTVVDAPAGGREP